MLLSREKSSQNKWLRWWLWRNNCSRSSGAHPGGYEERKNASDGSLHRHRCAWLLSRRWGVKIGNGLSEWKASVYTALRYRAGEVDGVRSWSSNLEEWDWILPFAWRRETLTSLRECDTVINKSGKHPTQLVTGDILQNALISTFSYLFSLPIG